MFRDSWEDMKTDSSVCPLDINFSGSSRTTWLVEFRRTWAEFEHVFVFSNCLPQPWPSPGLCNSRNERGVYKAALLSVHRQGGSREAALTQGEPVMRQQCEGHALDRHGAWRRTHVCKASMCVSLQT